MNYYKLILLFLTFLSAQGGSDLENDMRSIRLPSIGNAERGCDDCEIDWSAYGSECCDTAWDEYGINCATLEGTYGWDCSGCSCPDDDCPEGYDECGDCGGNGVAGACGCTDTSTLNEDGCCDDIVLNEDGCCDDIVDLGCGCGEAAALSYCEDTDFIFSEDFESYNAGDYIAASSDAWYVWSELGGTPYSEQEDGIIDSQVHLSGNNSLKIVEGNDLVIPLGDRTEGKFSISFNYFVVSGYGAYFNFQHFEEVGNEWANEVIFYNDGGQGSIQVAGELTYFNYTQDEWTSIDNIIDLDNDEAELWINGNHVLTWSWHLEAYERTNQLGGLDIYGDTNNLYYVDNLLFGDGLGNPGTETLFCDDIPVNQISNCYDPEPDCITNDECEGGEIFGCMDETACNYDEDALIEGVCTYPETYYNCDGTCIADTDCAGECGGSAEVDECGACNGDNSTCTDCAGVLNGDAETDICGDCGGYETDPNNCDCILVCEDTDGDGLGNPGSEICDDGNIDVTDGCMLPDSDTIGYMLISSDGYVLYKSPEAFSGFQFSVIGQPFGDIRKSGFDASDFEIRASEDGMSIFGASIDSNPIPAGCGTLLQLTDFDNEPAGFSISLLDASMANNSSHDLNDDNEIDILDHGLLVNCITNDNCYSSFGGGGDWNTDSNYNILDIFDSEDFIVDNNNEFDFIVADAEGHRIAFEGINLSFVANCSDEYPDCHFNYIVGDDSTCEDCAGVPYGDDFTCLDCTGMPNGNAVEDECGTCIGGSTGLDPGDDPSTGDQWECPYDGPNECGNYADISASACDCNGTISCGFGYDDDSFEEGYNVGDGNSFAVRFEAGIGQELKAFEWYQTVAGGIFNITVWDNDCGLPGEEIYSTLQPTNDNQADWNRREFDTAIFVSGTFWVGITEFSTTTPIGLDANTNESNSYHNSNGGWEQITGNLGIRIEFSNDCILDECGVCDGPGAVYECGCSDIPDGYCDCSCNVVDCDGECDGSTVVDCNGECGGSAILACEDTDGDGFGNSDANDEFCVDLATLSADINDFCAYEAFSEINFTVPANRLYVNSSGDVYYNTLNDDISGFQFNIEGASLLGASGGAAEAAGFIINVNPEDAVVIGYSLGGPVIEPGCGILVELEVDGDPSLADIIMSDNSGAALEFDIHYSYVADCSDIDPDCVDNYFDCAGECGGSAEVDECGVCGYVDSCLSGCMDPAACNFDCLVGNMPLDNEGSCNDGINLVDNSSCIYSDCNGLCGGVAVLDDCGACDGDNSACYYNIDFCGVTDGDNSTCNADHHSIIYVATELYEENDLSMPAGEDDASCGNAWDNPCSTIQMGITHASDGDTVLVAPGEYMENLILDKTITLASYALFSSPLMFDNWVEDVSGPSGDDDVALFEINIPEIETTIINGAEPADENFGSVIGINSSDCIEPQVLGFTITNGVGTVVTITEDEVNDEGFVTEPAEEFITGGGILIQNALPRVHYNLIKNCGCLEDYASQGRTERARGCDDSGIGGGISATGVDIGVNFPPSHNHHSPRDECEEGGLLDLSNNFFLNNEADFGAVAGGLDFSGFYVDLSGSYWPVYSSYNDAAADYYISFEEDGDGEDDGGGRANDYIKTGGGFGTEEAALTAIYVSSRGSDSNDGSESNPLKTIGRAYELLYATEDSPGTIYLGAGVYSPSITGEKFPILISSNINIEGRGPALTILDGEKDGAGGCDIGWNECEDVNILYFKNIDNTKISNMTLTGGGEVFRGGAAYLINSNPHLDNLIIYNNWAYVSSAIYAIDSDYILTNSIVRENSLYNNNHGPWGGHTRHSFEFERSDAILSHVAIHSNNDGSHEHSRSGLNINNNSNVIFNDVTFTDHGGSNNTAVAISIIDSDPMFINSTFTNNYSIGCSSPSYNGCTSNSNNCDQGYLFELRGYSTQAIWKNSIVWGNFPYEMILQNEHSTGRGSYSNIRGSYCPAWDVDISGNWVNNTGEMLFDYSTDGTWGDECNCIDAESNYLENGCVIECDENNAYWTCHMHEENSNWNSCNGAINENGIAMGDQGSTMTWEEENMLDVPPYFDLNWEPRDGQLIPGESYAYLDMGDPNPLYNDQSDNTINNLGAYGGSNLVPSFDFYDFNEFGYGQSGEMAWFLTNLREEAVTITDASFPDSPGGNFSVLSSFPIVIDPFERGGIRVRFEAPNDDVMKTGRMTLSSPDIAEGAHVDFRGSGIESGEVTLAGYIYGTLPVSGSPYRVDNTIYVGEGDTLIIEPGVDLLFDGHFGMTVEGTLIAEGTATAPIEMKNYYMPTESNDPGYNCTTGTGTSGCGTFWTGVIFKNSNSSLAHVNIEYVDGVSGDNSEYSRGLVIGDGSNLTVSHLNISHCMQGAIILLEESFLDISYSNIFENGNANYYPGIYSLTSSIIIDHCSFIGNGGPSRSFGSALRFHETDAVVSNSLIFGNYGPGRGTGYSGSFGSAIKSSDGTFLLYNSTITNNIARNHNTQGGYHTGYHAVLIDGGVATIINNIIRENSLWPDANDLDEDCQLYSGNYCRANGDNTGTTSNPYIGSSSAFAMGGAEVTIGYNNFEQGPNDHYLTDGRYRPDLDGYGLNDKTIIDLGYNIDEDPQFLSEDCICGIWGQGMVGQDTAFPCASTVPGDAESCIEVVGGEIISYYQIGNYELQPTSSNRSIDGGTLSFEHNNSSFTLSQANYFDEPDLGAFEYYPSGGPEYYGCTDPSACNFKSEAIYNDLTCIYSEDDLCGICYVCEDTTGDICGEPGCEYQCGNIGQFGPDIGCDGVCLNNGGHVYDCGEVCGGTDFSCADCAGVPQGYSWESACGCVSADNSGDDCDDCAGIPNGDAEFDDCGICGGDGVCITNLSIDLIPGWNWISINLDMEDHSVSSVLESLGDNATDITSQSAGTSINYSSQGGSWYGVLEEIEPAKMYKLKMAAPATLTLTGYPVDVTSTPISLLDGWNWIPFLPQYPGGINAALESIDDLGTFISSQFSGASTYYEIQGSWYGSLATLEPGLGYILHMDGPGELIYPELDGLVRMLGINKKAVMLPETISNWEFNFRDYEYIGNITASIESREDFDGDIVGVFVDGQCRGIAERMYFPYDDHYYYIIQVYSNDMDGDKMTFQYYNKSEDEVVGYTETIEFTNNMIIGDGFNTFELKRELIIPEEYSLGSAYPNPFNPATTMEFGLPVDGEVTIQVYDLQGRKLVTLVDNTMKAGYHTVIWDANRYSSGIYFVKMVSAEYVNTQKLMLVK